MLVEIQFAASTSRWQRWQNWRLDWGCATLSPSLPPSSSRAAGGTGVEDRQCRPASGMEGGGVKRMRRGRGGGSPHSPPLLSVSSATRLLGQAVTAGTRSPFHSTEHQKHAPQLGARLISMLRSPCLRVRAARTGFGSLCCARGCLALAPLHLHGSSSALVTRGWLVGSGTSTPPRSATKE
jgi:hypothetical protein